MKIFLFDPSLASGSAPSSNLGDVIIYQAVSEILEELFPDAEVTRASSHVPPDAASLEEALDADLTLVGGTNLLSSHVAEYNQWRLSADPLFLTGPADIKAILLGVGWWQYQDRPDKLTGTYYRSLLHPRLPHAARDSYTQVKLASCGIPNVLHTSCPTLWKLNGLECDRIGNNRRCLFCLTDYKPDVKNDTALIDLLLTKYDSLTFFPQGEGDMRYIHHIPAFNASRERITVLPHEVDAFFAATEQPGFDYIGTRLHAGARCLQVRMPSLILAVDNRSIEIARDTNLPVVARSDREKIEAWIDHKLEMRNIALPLKNISAWKSAITQYAARLEEVSCRIPVPAY
jgi:hypothetical protein